MCDMFARIATRYDFYNDFLSFGIHRLTRRRVLLREMNLQPGQLVLDLRGDRRPRPPRRGSWGRGHRCRWL